MDIIASKWSVSNSRGKRFNDPHPLTIPRPPPFDCRQTDTRCSRYHHPRHQPCILITFHLGRRLSIRGLANSRYISRYLACPRDFLLRQYSCRYSARSEQRWWSVNVTGTRLRVTRPKERVYKERKLCERVNPIHS